ncbi:CASP-like protein [Gossypium australe]|uniref:CASP-like protein n=1 Tax=Gossypium australe TaxID=47621 RepID=A0A5B6VZI3_9ROSI|nr:CASP-like protein [Gossypium australe]
MEAVPGALGTSASLALRLGQTVFSAASLLFMCLDVEFYSYTSFRIWIEVRQALCVFLPCKIAALPCWREQKFFWFLLDLRFKKEEAAIFKKSCFLLMDDCRESYLVTVMGLVTPWSVSLALVDAYSVFVKGLPRQPRVLLVVIVGDWALSFLSLAAACSTASVTNLLVNVSSTYCPSKICSRYQLSAAMAFMSWFLSFASTLFNLWLLPSL